MFNNSYGTDSFGGGAVLKNVRQKLHPILKRSRLEAQNITMKVACTEPLQNHPFSASSRFLVMHGPVWDREAPEARRLYVNAARMSLTRFAPVQFILPHFALVAFGKHTFDASGLVGLFPHSQRDPKQGHKGLVNARLPECQYVHNSTTYKLHQSLPLFGSP